MSYPDGQDQSINFGSDLSVRACVKNCIDGECCDCDHHDEPPPTPPAPGQQLEQPPTDRDSLLSAASSGQGPSQPRPINITAQPYQAQRPMQYGAAASYSGWSNVPQSRGHAGGGGAPASYGGYQGHASGHTAAVQGGVFIAPETGYPPGFTTPASSVCPGPQGGGEVTRTQESLGWFRDGEGRLVNSWGELINERGEVLAAEQQPGPPGDSPPASGGGSRAGSSHGRGGGRKLKNQ